MISMKLPKKTKKEMEAMNRPVMMDDGEKYPYGLKINLGKEELKKLGIDVSKLKVEQIGKLAAMIKITDIRSHESMREENSSENLELQITEMEVALGESKPKTDKFQKYHAGLSEMGGMVK